MTHAASPSETLILPGLLGLLREAADAAGLFVAEAKPQVLAHIAPEGGKIDRRLADAHQHRVHGYGWYAAYAELLNQVAGWAERLQDEGQFGNALIFTPFNYQRGRIYGVEFSGNWRDDRWLLYANLAMSRSTARDIRSAQFTFAADELSYIAHQWIRTDHDQVLTGSAGAVLTAGEGGRVSTSMLYGSGMRRGFANTDKLSPYATVNLGVQQDVTGPDRGTWTLRLDVLNIFDTAYQLRDGSGIGVGAPQYGTRRGIFGGLSRAF